MEKVYISFDSKGKILFASTNLENLHRYSQKYLDDIKSAGYEDSYTIKEEILLS